MPIFGGEIGEGMAGKRRCRGQHDRETPPRVDRDLGAGQGRKRGERTGTWNGGRRRHVAQGAGTSSGGWQMASAGDVQVGDASHQKLRWGAGVNKRALKMNRCKWRGGRKEEEIVDPGNDRRKRWGRRARLKVSSISDKSLGAEGSMSEVGIPPPNNLNKPHAPVARNYHTITKVISVTPV